MCACAPRTPLASGQLRENVDLTPGVARRWLLGWRRRRLRPSRRAPRAAALPPARTPGLGPGRPGSPLRSAPPRAAPRARRPAPGARSQTEVRAAANEQCASVRAGLGRPVCFAPPAGGWMLEARAAAGEAGLRGLFMFRRPRG